MGEANKIKEEKVKERMKKKRPIEIDWRQIRNQQKKMIITTITHWQQRKEIKWTAQ